VKSRASGEVLRVLVETGDDVEQGALLVEIDPRDVRLEHEQASADLELARVRSQITESRRDRMTTLRADNLVTQEEHDAALEAAADARSALIRAQTNLALAKEKLGDVTIRAPIKGTVIEKTVEPGQIIASATGNVSGGTTLLKLADLAEIRLRALIDETDIGRISPGQAAQVTVEAHAGRTFEGEIEKIEPLAVVDQNVTMFPVLVRLANPARLLKPGMNAEVSIEVARREDVVVVPNTAIVNPRDVRRTARLLGVDESAAGGRSGNGSGTRNGGRPEGRSGGAPGDASAGQSAGAPSGASDRTAQRPSEGSAREGRAAVVFVRGASGPEARPVQLGVGDWDRTEVLAGLEPGEEVVRVTVAELQEQQASATQRMRERFGGGGMITTGGGSQSTAQRR
jgi:HlyD family secretion protein